MPGLVFRKDEDDLNRYVRRNNAKTAEQLEKRGLDPRKLLNTEIGFLSTLGHFGGVRLEFDPFQLRFLACSNRFRSLLKSRQVGYSFIMAAEMLARTHLRDTHHSVCISYNLDDAKEKISLIKELHDDLPLGYQKKIVTDTKTEISFESRAHKRRISKVNSLPSKAPRGKWGDVYIDEFAHCLNDRAIYAGATACTIRHDNQVTIGSTPLGKRGMFFRIHEQSDAEFRGFWRMDVPWWRCKKFCKDPIEAAKFAPTLATADRVERFGTRQLYDQFGALPLDDFQQEYELNFQDERIAFFPLELILACCRFDAGDRDDFRGGTLRIFESPEELALEAEGLGPLYAGFDVGRTKHASELIVLEERENRFTLRYKETFRNVPFATQLDKLSHLITLLGNHLRAFRIDRTGLGLNLAEDLFRKFGPKIEQWHFTNQIKVELANNLKILLEGRALDLPKNRDMIGQLGSMKQKISESGNTIFDVSKNEKHHCDLVWGLALAGWRKRKRVMGPAEVGIRIIGEKPEPEPPESPSEDQPITKPPVDDLARIFDVPDTKFVPRRKEFAPDPNIKAVLEGDLAGGVLGNAPTDALERRARMLRISLATWEQSGKNDQIPEAERELQTIEVELSGRS